MGFREPHGGRRHRRGRGALLVVALVVASVALGPPAHAQAAEQIPDGGFTSGPGAWWATANSSLSVVDGQLCAPVPAPTAQPWDVIIGLNDIPLVRSETYRFAVTMRASVPDVNPRVLVQMNGAPYTTYLDTRPAVGTAAQTYEFVFQPAEDNPAAQVAFQLGGLSAEPWTFCIDDVSLTGGATRPEHQWNTEPRLHVNQVGYLPDGPKRASLSTAATAPLAFAVRDGGGRVVHTGWTVPRGIDRSAGEGTHEPDFTALRATGTGFTVEADGAVSHPFALSADPYRQLRADAFGFYYPMRSGIAIDDTIKAVYGRPAGHVGVAPNQGDTSVPCAGPKDAEGNYTGPPLCPDATTCTAAGTTPGITASTW